MLQESKFAIKKWYVIDSQTAKGKYNQNSSVKFETESIKPSLCDYSDAFILVAADITVTANNDTDVAFKNWAPFSTCKTEINGVFIDEANHIYIQQFTLQYLCSVWLNIVIIIQTYQEVYGSLKGKKV